MAFVARKDCQFVYTWDFIDTVCEKVGAFFGPVPFYFLRWE